MTSYHESLWEQAPEGRDPSDWRLRLAFLLDGVATISSRAGGGGPPAVLDLGCGDGRFAAELVRAGASVTAADVAEAALARTGERARALELDVELRLIPLDGAWPLADASFEVVWAGETIEHVADTAGWLSELRRVLRSGGRLLLSTPAHGRLRMLGLALSRRRLDDHFDPRSDHLRFYTARTLTRLLEDFGFEDINVRAAGGLPGARRLLLASARRTRF